MNLKILFFGDVSGRVGRNAITKILPSLKKKLDPDLVIANAENIAHGVGITEKTLQELIDAGVDFFTSGDHVFDKKDVLGVLEDKNSPLIRPANFQPGVPGRNGTIAGQGHRKPAPGSGATNAGARATEPRSDRCRIRLQ